VSRERFTTLVTELFGDPPAPQPAANPSAHPQRWPQAVTQVAEQLCATLGMPVAPERLRKALDLVLTHAVTLHADGTASVQSGTQTYTLNPECPCGDAKNRAAFCKHTLAVELHRRALALLDGTAYAAAAAPSASPAAAVAAAPPAVPPHAPTSAAWDVHEAPVSSCFKIRVGALEWTHTMRARDDAELETRLQAFLPTFRAITAALEALHAEREAAKAAPAAPAQPPAAPAAVPQADLQALLQQAVQQALAAHANGQAQGTLPPAAPSSSAAANGAAPDDQQTGFCSMHQVPMERKQNDRGVFYGHWLADEQRHCNGRRTGRR
jgi:hypothetical protein